MKKELMPVFRNLMAVGVSGAMTLVNVGQGVAVPSSVESQDSSFSNNPIPNINFKPNQTQPKEFTFFGVASPQENLPALTLPKNLKQVHDSSARSIALQPNPFQTPFGQSIGSQMQLGLSTEVADSQVSNLRFKQNPLKPQPPDVTAPGSLINGFLSPSPDESQVSSTVVFETAFKQNPLKPQAGISESLFPPATDSSDSYAVEVALTDNTTVSQNSIPEPPDISRDSSTSPEQLLAQAAEPPSLQIPDLTPPSEPYPPPTPDGTLQTNPPPVVLPSSDLLYRPNVPQEVEIEETVPITLQQAVDLARRNNEGIRVFELQVEQRLAALRSAQATLYPTLSFISSLSRSRSASTDIANRARNRETEFDIRRALENAETEQERAQIEQQRQSISLSETFGVITFDNQLLFQYDFDLSGERGARIQAAHEQLRLSELEFERSVEQLRLDVTEDYYDLQQTDAEVEIQRAAVRNAQKSLEDAEALERAGVGTRFEVLQARVTLSRVQQDLTNAISNQRTARRQLSNILNISQNINLVAADPITLAGTWEDTLENSIVQAYQNRSELEQELVSRNLAEQQRIQARAAQRPNLTTSASYNVLGILSDNKDPFANQGWADGYSVQMQLRWDFFDGGLAKANARQQEINVAIAEEQYSQLLNDIRLEVESAYYDLQATFENIGVANLGVEEASEALRLARLRFQAGVGTQLDVINQETDLTRAQNQLLQAIIGYNRSLSRLHRAVSNLPDANLQDKP